MVTAMVSAEQLVKSAKLYTLPEIYVKLRDEMNNPSVSASSMANIIKQDPSLTTRVLQLVNSAFFGLGKKIETVSHAVTLLGHEQIHDLVLATSVIESFSKMDNEIINMNAFCHNSVYCGVLASAIAKYCNVLDHERLFVTGLLRDIGHLVLYQKLPEQINDIILESRKTGRPLHELELAKFGYNYAIVGACLIKEFGLPTSIENIIKYHVNPEDADGYELEASIIHIAGVITCSTRDSSMNKESELVINQYALDCIGLELEKMTDIQEEAQILYEQTLRAFNMT